MFCARVLRDETTVNWLEDFLDHNGLDDLHACDALRCSSDEYLTRLLKEPPIVLEIKKPIPGRTNNKNPYIQRRYFTYDVEIIPRKLALRVLEARRQIAEELTSDIPSLARESSRQLELYRQRVVGDDPASMTASLLNLPSYSVKSGSPFRSANFDLVKNYTLYLGIGAVVKQLFNSGTSEGDADWMAEFFMTHGRELIQPHRGVWGRADEVVEKLLMTAPSVRGGALFDPALLTERVLEMRGKCAEVWISAMREAEADQTELIGRVLENEI